MESLNKTVIISGNLLALAATLVLVYMFLMRDAELYVSIPIGIGLVGLIVVVLFTMDSMDYSRFHNTFAMFDYHAYLEVLKSWVANFIVAVMNVGEALIEFGTVGIAILILLIFPLVMTVLGFAVFVAMFALYGLAVMMAYTFLLALAKGEEAGRYAKDTRRCVCPSCGSVFPRPVHVCSCGERYPSGGNIPLRPSIHGLLHTNCANDGCGRKLPVTDRRRERRALDAVCPECGGSIRTREARPYIISLAGPPGSGKTTFAFSALSALESRGSTTRPYGDAHALVTPNAYSPPYVISVDVSRRTDRSLFFFDISGSYFDSDHQGFQPQYGQEDMMVIVIDPSAVDARESSELASNDFWQKVHTVTQTSLSQVIRVPLHLVVTHKDSVGGHDDVRAYLDSEGYGQMVSSLESSFSSVSYHICDARSEDDVSRVLGDMFSSIDGDVAGVFNRP